MLNPSLGSVFYYLTQSLTPLPYLVWMAISKFFGTEHTTIFRMSNILIHSVNGWLVYQVIKKHFYKAREINLTPLMAATLFLIHPAQVESVLWISSLRGLMGAFFALLCLYQFLEYFSQPQRDLTPLYFSFFALVGGLLSKPTMIAMILCLPVVLILKDPDINFRETLRKEKPISWFLGILFLAGLLIFIFHKKNVLTPDFAILGVIEKIKLVLSSLGTYVTNTLFPFQLTFDYQLTPFTLNYLQSIGQKNNYLFIAIIFLMTLFSIFWVKKYRRFMFLMVMYLFLLAPHVGLVSHDFHNISIVADRYMYLALFPACLLTAEIFDAILLKFKSLFKYTETVSLFFVITLSLVSFHQVHRWKDQEKFLLSSNKLKNLNIPILTSLASNAFNEDQFRKANKYLSFVLSGEPDNILALSILLQIFNKNPTVEVAITITDAVYHSENQITPDLYLPLARVYLYLENVVKAKEFAEKAVIFSNDKEKAEEAYQDVLNIQISFTTTRLEELYNFYFSKMDKKAARKFLEELIILHPKNAKYQKKLEDINGR